MKKVFILKNVVVEGSQKRMARRTLIGKLNAVISLNFIAEGIVTDELGHKEILENQTYKALKARGIELIKIPGMKKDMAIAL